MRGMRSGPTRARVRYEQNKQLHRYNLYFKRRSSYVKVRVRLLHAPVSLILRITPRLARAVIARYSVVTTLVRCLIAPVRSLAENLLWKFRK